MGSNKVFIYVDENKIVKCIATDESNIWKDAAWGLVKKLRVGFGGTIGDEYDEASGEWTPHPENYPKKSRAEVDANKYIERTRLELAKVKADADNNADASAELQKRIDAL